MDAPYLINRNSLRMIPENFSDYVITLKTDSNEFQAYIGDISETGVLALFSPENDLQDLQNAFQNYFINHNPEKKILDSKILDGKILGKNANLLFDFQGQVVWLEEARRQISGHISGHINGNIAMGIQFETAFILPEEFYVLPVKK